MNGKAGRSKISTDAANPRRVYVYPVISGDLRRFTKLKKIHEVDDDGSGDKGRGGRM